MKLLSRIFAVVLFALPGLAFAHNGDASHSHLAAGVLHPLSGLDHLLAMVAVGCFAASLGGKALWQLPTAFVAAMLIGGAFGIAGLALPAIEPMIVASSVVIGLALAIRGQMPTLWAAGLCASFAIFHGVAHGLEMPAAGSAVAYAVGFSLATAALHLAGLATGWLSQALVGKAGSPWLGAGIALAGLGLAVG